MKEFKVIYDEKEDILFLAREGQEEEIVELAPVVLRVAELALLDGKKVSSSMRPIKGIMPML